MTDPTILDPQVLRLGAKTFQWGTRTFVMAVLNVTPDSFSGDGVAHDPRGLEARIEELAEAAPDVIDVGGESTRPGAAGVRAQEEINRITPAFGALRSRAGNIPLSIDTRKAVVARAALDLGAVMINDVTGGAHDPALRDVAAAVGAAFIVTHSRRGETRYSSIGPHVAHVPYNRLIDDIRQDSQQMLEAAQRAGVAEDRLLLDPGFGFGKSPEQNLELLRNMKELRLLGAPLVVGVSRKSFVGRVLGLPADQRLEGSLAASVIAVANGADMVRTHDVEATRRALSVADAIYRHDP